MSEAEEKARELPITFEIIHRRRMFQEGGKAGRNELLIAAGIGIQEDGNFLAVEVYKGELFVDEEDMEAQTVQAMRKLKKLLQEAVVPLLSDTKRAKWYTLEGLKQMLEKL